MNRRLMMLFSLAVLLGFLLPYPTHALAQGVQITEEKEDFTCPVWSPDGQFLAVTRGDWRGICRINPDGTQLEELIADRGAGYKFVWSPDGRHIAYRAEKLVEGERYFAMKIVDVEDKAVRQITEFRRFLGTPRWVFPQGMLVFQTNREGGLEQVQAVRLTDLEAKGNLPSLVAVTSRDLQIWVSNPDGGERTLVSGLQERCFDPTLSPNGDRVCYTCLRDGGSIVVTKTDGTGRVNLGYGSNPCWSPDGSRLVYEVTEDDGMVITGSDLYLIGADGGGKTQLTDTPGLVERWPDWSPDGARIAYSAGGSIYILPIQETNSSGE